jgi:hypothetical protein
MTPGTLSQLFSWSAIVCSVLAALSTAFALHYKTVAAGQQAHEIASLKPRTLSEAQKSALRKSLAARSGTVGFIHRLMDGEGQDFTKDLGSVFTDAGWHVASSAGNSLNDFTGYIVIAVSDPKLLSDLQFVKDALNQASIDCRTEDIKPGSLGGPLLADRVWLIVGRKQ